MKKIALIVIGVFFLVLLGNYVEKYSKETLRMRTRVYAIKDQKGWSEEKCSLIVSQKEDSLLDAYFPGIGVLIK